MSELLAARNVLSQAIQRRAFPGAVYGVLLRGSLHALGSAGNFTYDSGSPRVDPYTVFDLASVTKVLATTSMAMLLFDRGQLALDEPVLAVLPEFAGMNLSQEMRSRVTPAMLLAHCSGLPAYAPLYARYRTREGLVSACMNMPLKAEPGKRAVYSDIGFIVLGHLLERIAGEPLDAFCRREIFSRLEMSSTLYCPPESLRTTIPPTSAGDTLSPVIVQGVVHDENCRAMGGVAGHAGVFSSATDCLQFAACILGGGTPLFRPETVERFATRCQKPAGTTRALGWDTPSQPSQSGSFFGARSIGHLGYTGTSLWLDPEKQLAVVLLTNRTWPGSQSESEAKQIAEVRPSFHDSLLQELGFGDSHAGAAPR